MKKIVNLVILMLSFLLLVSCQDGPVKDALSVEYDEILYVNQVGKIKVESIYEDDIINIKSQNPKIVEIIENSGDDKIAKAVGKGVATIHISNKYGNEIDIEIFVDEDTTSKAPLENVVLSIVEDGPYYVRETYHLKMELYPANAYDDFRFYESTNFDINEETLEIVFNMPGTFEINLYAKKSHKLFSLTVNAQMDREEGMYAILFIGNSLTYVHDIPNIIKSMITADGGYMIHIQDTPGGSTITSHYEAFKTIINQYEFTHIVLQGQSNEPVSKKEEFLSGIKLLADEVKDTKTELIVYETWCYDGEQYRYSMTEGLKESYEEAAELIGARITRSGEAFRLFEETYGTEPSLYQDLNHQSVYGAFLSACVHYSTFTGKRASDNEFVMEGIEEDIAIKIKEIADRISFQE